jgi:hypothetical protein
MDPTTPAGAPITKEGTMAVRWKGKLAPLDVDSPDGRRLVAPSGPVRTRPLPLPLLYLPQPADIGRGAQRIGTIDSVTVDDDKIMWGAGELNEGPALQVCREFELGRGYLGVDVDDTLTEEGDDGLVVFTDWQLAAATIYGGANKGAFGGQARITEIAKTEAG